jgi:hypothetical protein
MPRVGGGPATANQLPETNPPVAPAMAVANSKGD